MKPTRYKKWAALALALANGFWADAQSNRVPGPTDYSAFSGFITARNIFDPYRFPRNSGVRPIRPPQQRGLPTFALVGTMSYEKGMFVFFDGTAPELRKVLYTGETNGIAGYTVKDITPTGVELQTADEKRTVQMKIGDQMRLEGSEWQLFGQNGRNEMAAGARTAEGAASEAVDASTPDASSAPSSALEQSDVLKKLMQQREQELK